MVDSGKAVEVMMDKFEIQNLIIALIRAGLRGESAPADVCEKLSENTLSEIYKIAKRHDMAHFLAQTLENFLPADHELSAAFANQLQMAVYRYEQINYEYENLCKAFEKEKIFFIPLKGAVIRKFYPEPWMRTSCDIDILVDENDLGRAENACEALDYELQSRNFHDVSFSSPGGVHLELHFSICENMKNLDKLLKNVKDHVRPARDTGYEYALDPDYFIFHNVAHSAYHFLQGGCGIRSVLDLWLLRNNLEYDEERVKAFCRECGVEKFYLSLVQLSEVWFGGGARDELTDKLQNYIFDGGVYGTIENRASVSEHRGGRFRSLWWYTFLPLSAMQVAYPILKKHKWLLPFYWVRRWLKILFRRGGVSQETRRSMSARAKLTAEEKTRVAELLKDVELL